MRNVMKMYTIVQKENIFILNIEYSFGRLADLTLWMQGNKENQRNKNDRFSIVNLKRHTIVPVKTVSNCQIHTTQFYLYNNEEPN